MSGILLLLIASTLSMYLIESIRRRRRTTERLVRHAKDETSTEERKTHRRVTRSFPPRHRLLVAGVGLIAGLAAWVVAGFPAEVSMAVGLLIGVIASLVDDFEAGRQVEAIEEQLASAIYLMVGSLRAGASLLAAFDSALDEIGAPLKPYLQEVAGRIRLGDDPRTAVADFQTSVPLESFQLFATALVVHWEVGGSLATTLSTVGATIRDRVELGRRVRAQAVEANASVAVVLGIVYILGFLMWRTNPGRMEAFLTTGAGTTIAAGVITLQAVGLLWMSRLSRGSL